MKIISGIGLSLIVIFLLAIFAKPNKRFSDYFLILTNTFLAFLLLGDMWVRADMNAASYIFHNLVPFWLFPIFVTYGLSLINEDHRFQWRKNGWIYSIAVVFSLVLSIDILLLKKPTAQVLYELYTDPPILYHLFFKSQKLFVIFVMIWFLRKLDNYQEKIKEIYSYVETIRLEWLKYFSWLVLILYSLAFVSFLVYNFGFVEEIDLIYLINNIGLVLTLFYLSYNGIRQYTLAVFMEQQHEETAHGSASDKTKEKEELLADSAEKESLKTTFREMTRLFEKDQVYLEPQIKVADVAELLNVAPHHLSNAINTLYGKPFYDFVNHYRVEQLKENLVAPQKQPFTILALAYEAGFNSKASLNRIFKDHTGQTPSQYKKTHLAKGTHI